MTEAVNPVDGKKCVVQISHQSLMMAGKRSKGQALEAAYILPYALQQPVAVYEGLCWDSDEDRRGVGWRCYVSKPDFSYSHDGKKQGPWENELFLVFVNHENVAYNWRWEKCDPSTGMLPGLGEGQTPRFQKRLL